MRPYSINVTDFGAVGDGLTDDTNAIQEAIKVLLSRNYQDPAVLDVPSGNYLLSETVNFDRLRGCLVRGCGSLRIIGSGAPTKTSMFTWIGKPGGTMIRYAGSQCVFERLSLYGQEENSSSEKPSAGVLWQNASGKGIGSGKTSFYNMTFRNADVGVKSGENISDGNIDYFTHCASSFRDLSTAYLVTNRQSVGHYFIGITYLSNLETAFRFDGGGDFRLDMSLLTQTKEFLSLPGKSNAVGINNASFRAGYLDYDNHIGGMTPQLLVMDDYVGDGSRNITFDEVRMHKFSQLDDDRPLFDFGGDAFLTVRRFADLNTDRHWCKIRTDDDRNKQPRALFEQCHMQGYNPPSEQYGKVHWIMRECFNAKTGDILPPLEHDWTRV